MDQRELTPPYFRYLVHLIRPFPNYDLFFIKGLRRKAVQVLKLKPGNRVLDVGCGPGGTFPYLRQAVGPAGEVVGVEISPEVAINARRRIAANGWSNVHVVEADARSVQLQGKFDGMVLIGAPDVYASPAALANLLPCLNDGACIVAFGAKLSRQGMGRALNPLFRSLIKLSFDTTPALSYEPWQLLETYLDGMQVEEYFFGCMFLAWGRIRASPTA